MLAVTVLASGGGGNLRAILQHDNHLKLYRVIKVATNRDCGALAIADSFQIEKVIFDSSSSEDYFKVIPSNTDLVVLAGFLPIVPKDVCLYFKDRIINIHPSLLPKYGGKGMYGVKVHQEVLAANESFSGCTVHFVTPEIDMGMIIQQAVLPIPPGIDALALRGLVFELERELLPNVISKLAARD